MYLRRFYFFSLIALAVYLLQLPVTLLAHKHCIFHDADNAGSMIFFRDPHTLSITAVRLSKLRGRIDVPASLWCCPTTKSHGSFKRGQSGGRTRVGSREGGRNWKAWMGADRRDGVSGSKPSKIKEDEKKKSTTEPKQEILIYFFFWSILTHFSSLCFTLAIVC